MDMALDHIVPEDKLDWLHTAEGYISSLRKEHGKQADLFV
jgi:hypothetical protein